MRNEIRFEEVKGKEGEVKLPEYGSKTACGADFYVSERVVIGAKTEYPVLVKTGVKAKFPSDVCLMLANRSSNPMKLGLELANGVGIVESDYYGNPSNDGEIMFAMYNRTRKEVVLEEGDKIGQGVFYSVERSENYRPEEIREREGGFGSTGRR